MPLSPHPTPPEEGARRSRWGRLLLLLALAGAALLAGGYFFVKSRYVNDALRTRVETELSKALDLPVTVGSIRAGFSGNIVFQDVGLRIPLPPHEVRLDIDRVEVDLKLADLVLHHRRLEDSIENVSVFRPRVRFVRGTLSVAAGTAPAVPGPSKGLPFPLPPVPRITVRGGEVDVQGLGPSGPLLRDLDIQIERLPMLTGTPGSSGTGSSYRILVEADPPSAGRSALAASALKLTAAFHSSPSPRLEGKLNVRRWPLARLAPLMSLEGVRFKEGDVDVESPLRWIPGSAPTYEARITLDRAGGRLPPAFPVSFSLASGTLNVSPTQIRCGDGFVLTAGGTPWSASGIVPLDGRPVSLTWGTERLSFGEVLVLLPGMKDVPVEGGGTATFEASGPLDGLAVSGHAEVKDARIADWRMSTIRLRSRYGAGSLRLEQAEASLYGGTLDARGVLDLAGGRQGAVSFRMSLKDVQAGPVGRTLGLADLKGKTELDLNLTGTLAKPVLKLQNTLTLDRAEGSKGGPNVIATTADLQGGLLELESVINQTSRFHASLKDRGDHWELAGLSLAGKQRGGHLQGKGVWPKSSEGEVRLSVKGRGMVIEQLPLVAEYLPRLEGLADLQVEVTGKRSSPRADVTAVSKGLRFRGGEGMDLDLDLTMTPESMSLRRLGIGKVLRASGTFGLKPGQAVEGSLEADGLPLALLASFLPSTNGKAGGTLKGKFRLGGTRGNLRVDGKGEVTAFQWAGFAADRASGSLATQQGRILVKELRLDRGAGSLTGEGWWDPARAGSPAEGSIDLKDFEVAKGFPLSGRWKWKSSTDKKGWRGALSTDELRVRDSRGKTYRFSPVSAEAASERGALAATVSAGAGLRVRYVSDSSAGETVTRIHLGIGPALLARLPEVTQFLPGDWKIAGELSGETEMERTAAGPWSLRGNLAVKKGTLQGYSFEDLGIEFEGTPALLKPRFFVRQAVSRYELAGTLECPGAFLGPESRISLNGPIENEKWANLLSLLKVSTEGHRVGGTVSGNLAWTGTVAQPVFQFALKGKDIEFDQFRSPSSNLQMSMAGGKVVFGSSHLQMEKGVLRIEEGEFSLDPKDPTLVLLRLKGATEGLEVSALRLTHRIEASGSLSLSARKDRPLFRGEVAFLRPSAPGAEPEALKVDVKIQDRRVELAPIQGQRAKLTGSVDFSRDKSIVFERLSFEDRDASFLVTGTLHFAGTSDLTSDARNIRMEELGKWLMPDFPLAGAGNYHLLFRGTMDRPELNASLKVTGGRWGSLPFDLLDGTLSVRDDTLRLGTKEVPISMRRQGKYELTCRGTVPFAMTETSRQRVREREMDIEVSMPKGDFGLLLLAGFAKEASGPMDLSFRVGGTLDDPILTADLDFKGCRLVPRMIAREIADLQGRIKVRNNKIVIEDLNAQIGQGRVFFWTPPLEDTKMVMENFVPRYFDIRVRTVTPRGVLLNIPAIMRPTEWGEIHFYGARPEDPLLIQGPLEETSVIGTALLAAGHYTFPPIVARDENGNEITYKELANVRFELTLEAGTDCWYSNDFSTSYLELKVDTGNRIIISGRDADKKPDRPGIQSRGNAGSKQGYLRYLSHEFKVREASLYIPQGQPPLMQGRGYDRIRNVEIRGPAGLRKEDVDFWVDFAGPFGLITFTLDSNPKLGDSNDETVHQQRLLSYVLFGRDMTGYGREELQAQYEQEVGSAAGDAALEALDRIASAQLSRSARRLTQKVGGLEINVKQGLIKDTIKARPVGTPEAGGEPVSVVTDAEGNTLPGRSESLASVEFRKYLDSRLGIAAVGVVGVGREEGTERTTFQQQVGLDYEVTRDLTLNTRVGENEEGQNEQSVGFQFRTQLPDAKRPRAGDVTPPHFERFDLYVLGPGKVQIVWTTDEVTRTEIHLSIPDQEDTPEQVIPEKQQDFEYRHEMVLEGLQPENEYRISLSASDLNGNTARSPVKTFTTMPAEEE